jgi:hypothetical protein
MTRFLTDWQVQPHGELVEIDRGVLTVEGRIRLPLGWFPRRMTVAALAGGGTAIWSAIALPEPEMQRIERLGPPRWLVVPGAAHRLDAFIWCRRYPDLKVLCSPGASTAVAAVVPVDATSDPFADPEVRFATVPGVGEHESALLVRRGGRLTLVLNDILANVRHRHGLGARIMARLMGFGTGRPCLPWLGRRIFVKDAAALAAALRGWADDPALARIVPSHGAIFADDPAAALRRAADDLER